MIGLFGMAAANAATLLAAHELLRRIRTDIPPLDLVLFLLLRFALISFVTLFALGTGIFTSAALGLLGAAGLAAMLGMPHAFTSGASSTLQLREHHVRFLKEARPAYEGKITYRIGEGHSWRGIDEKTMMREMAKAVAAE